MKELDVRYQARDLLFHLVPLYQHAVQVSIQDDDYQHLIEGGLVSAHKDNREYKTLKITQKGKQVLDGLVDSFAVSLNIKYW